MVSDLNVTQEFMPLAIVKAVIDCRIHYTINKITPEITNVLYNDYIAPIMFPLLSRLYCSSNKIHIIIEVGQRI